MTLPELPGNGNDKDNQLRLPTENVHSLLRKKFRKSEKFIYKYSLCKEQKKKRCVFLFDTEAVWRSCTHVMGVSEK